MDEFAELLQQLGLGHWLIIAGSVLMVVGAMGLLIRRSRRTGSGVEDEATPDEPNLNRMEAPSEPADHRPNGGDRAEG